MYRLCSNSQCYQLQLGLGTDHCPTCGQETDVEFEPDDVVKIDPTREARVIKKLSDHKDAGMSAVYLVERHRSSGAYVQGVLKVAKYNSAHALEREVGHLQQLRHNNIIRLLYTGNDKTARSAIWQDTKDGQRLEFIALEHMNDGSLKDKLSHGRPLPLPESVRIVEKIGRALDYMHSKNIMHLDVKSANILFNQNGHIVLSDFGVARNQTALTDLIRRRTHTGTLVYNAPELLNFNPSADHRVDIYALGLVLYEMLVGKNPVQVSTTSAGSSTQGRNVKKAIEALPRPRKINSRIPAEVEQVILKATHINFQDRYGSAAEMSQALRQAVAVYQKRQQMIKILGGLAAAALVLLVTLGTGGVYLLSAYRSTPKQATAAPTSDIDIIMDQGIKLGPEPDIVKPVKNENQSLPPPDQPPGRLPATELLVAPTSTRAALKTPTSRSTPSSRPPTRTKTASAPPGESASSPEAGSFSLVWPANDTAQPGKSIEFRWKYIQATACDPLPDNTYFEVRLWVEGQSPEGAMNAREEQHRIYCDPQTHIRSFTIGDIKSASMLSRFPKVEHLFWDVAIVRVDDDQSSYTVLYNAPPHTLTLPSSG